MAAMVAKDEENAVPAESLVLSAYRDGVEGEKCVVAQHRTTTQQRDTFKTHVEKNPINQIPVEWVIDIADESSGWFYGTAYHFDDTTRMIHVMVPDKHNPTFDGHVLLDYRTVHLIECVDGKTDALFNKIVRESIIKIRWELKWFEEEVEEPDEEEAEKTEDETGGRWVTSVGRYYIRIANQLLVEDEEVGGEKGFVMITADVNVRLHHCSKGRGQEDFNRLVLENQVQSTEAALEEAGQPISASGDPDDAELATGPAASVAASTKGSAGTSARGGVNAAKERRERRGIPASESTEIEQGANSQYNELAVGISRVWDMSKDLKECVSELLDEKDKEKDELHAMARAFSQFSLDGDLDAGLRLYVQAEEITFKQDSLANVRGGHAEKEALANASSHETWHLVQRVEKGLGKLVRATAPAAHGIGDASQTAATAAATLAEMELVKRRERKMRKDLEAREKELHVLRSAVSPQPSHTPSVQE